MQNILKYLREQIGQGVRNYFAPLKHWRNFLGYIAMLCLCLLPFHGWLTDGGYMSISDFPSLLALSFFLTMSLLSPMIVYTFGQIYPGFRRYGWGIILGGITNLVIVLAVVPQTPFVGANDGLIIVDNGVQTVVEHDDIRRYAPWDDRQFIRVENAYGHLETKTYQPCQETLCATIVRVRYGFSEPFIAANANNTTNYEAVVNMALINAVNVQGNTNADDVAAAMCTHIKAALELDAESSCPVQLQFSAQVDAVN